MLSINEDLCWPSFEQRKAFCIKQKRHFRRTGSLNSRLHGNADSTDLAYAQCLCSHLWLMVIGYQQAIAKAQELGAGNVFACPFDCTKHCVQPDQKLLQHPFGVGQIFQGVMMLNHTRQAADSEDQTASWQICTWPEVADQPMVLVKRFWISRTPS